MKRSPGFTLLEVAVAIAILGIAFTALFAGISSSLGGIPRVERSQRLVEQARNTFARVALVPELTASQNARGAYADGIRWNVRTTMSVPPDANGPHVLKIEVGVEDDDLALSFATYRFQDRVPSGILSLQGDLDALELP